MRLVAITLLTLTLGLLAPPLPAEAQQAGKVYRIGFLMGTSRPRAAPYTDVLLRQLRDLGWVEGKNFVTEYRFAEGRFKRFPGFAAELVRLKVDVIVTANTPATLAAKQATKTIPIVMAVVGDPVGSGLVASYARPGGNITGMSLLLPEIVGKQLELLKEVVPNASRVAVLWNPRERQTRMLREAKVAARALGVQLQILEAPGPEDFDSAFAAMTRERADALLVAAGPMFFLHRKRIVDLVAKHQLPAMYGLPGLAKPGGLMAYAPNLFDLFRRSATLVDKILRGAKPANLPIEQPIKFDFVINLKTAKALGLTIPPSVLVRADKVIR